MKRPANPQPLDQTKRLLKRIRQLEDAITAHRDDCQGSDFRYEDHPTYAPEAKLYAVLHSDW